MTNIMALPVSDNGARAANINDASSRRSVTETPSCLPTSPPHFNRMADGRNAADNNTVDMAVGHRIFISDKKYFLLKLASRRTGVQRF